MFWVILFHISTIHTIKLLSYKFPFFVRWPNFTVNFCLALCRRLACWIFPYQSTWKVIASFTILSIQDSVNRLGMMLTEAPLTQRSLQLISSKKIFKFKPFLTVPHPHYILRLILRIFQVPVDGCNPSTPSLLWHHPQTFWRKSNPSKSFEYIKKSNGPRKDPCGMPRLTSTNSEKVPQHAPLVLFHCD